MSRPAQQESAGRTVGQLRRAAENIAYSQAQRAYRAYLDHAASCTGCAAMLRRCPAAEGLWETYRATKAEAP